MSVSERVEKGNLTVEHNLRVNGWLIARNLMNPIIGIFRDEETLRKAYPYPRPGQAALVGTTIPADLWMVDEDGNWYDTGEKSGELYVVSDGDSGGSTGGETSGGNCDCEPSESVIGEYLPLSGGTISGNVEPDEAAKVRLGSSKKYFNETYTKTSYVHKLHLSSNIENQESGDSSIGQLDKAFDRAYINLLFCRTIYHNEDDYNGTSIGYPTSPFYQAYIRKMWLNELIPYTGTKQDDQWGDTKIGSSSISSYDHAYIKELHETSDERFKDNITDIAELTLDNIADAPVVEFSWKKNGRKSFGTIAQYWKKIFPSAVDEDDEGYLSIDYGKLALVCVVMLARILRRIIGKQ